MHKKCAATDIFREEILVGHWSPTYMKLRPVRDERPRGKSCTRKTNRAENALFINFGGIETGAIILLKQQKTGMLLILFDSADLHRLLFLHFFKKVITCTARM